MTNENPIGFTRVDHFRERAKHGAEGDHYKGLAVHALAGLHDHVAARALEVLPHGARVLDLAAGSGALSLRLKDLGFEVTSADMVPENFRLHGQVPFREIDLNSNFGDQAPEQLDGIFAVEIIEHLENPRNFLRQCRRALRVGGRLILTTPNPDNPISTALFVAYHRFEWFAEKDYRTQGHITPIGEQALRRICEENQLEVTRIDSYGDVYADRVGWKMRLLGRALEQLRRSPVQRGEILVAVLTRR